MGDINIFMRIDIKKIERDFLKQKFNHKIYEVDLDYVANMYLKLYKGNKEPSMSFQEFLKTYTKSHTLKNFTWSGKIV